MKLLMAVFAAGIFAATSASTADAQDTDRRAANSQVPKEQRISNWLSRQDTDSDGRISLEESIGLMKSNFERNDANGDGFLDRDELGTLADRLSRGPNANRTRRPRPTLTDEQVLEHAPDGVTVVLNIAYREGDDAWKLDLAMPSEPSDTPRPAIVFVHGGGWVGGDKRAGPFIGYALEYAAKGYVCVSVNYRLDSTKLPCVQDVKCAVRWFRAHAEKYNLDPERIGAYGNSAGAHLVAMLGLSHGDKRLEGDGPWQDFSSEVQAVAASATPTRPRLRTESDVDIKLIQPMSYVSGQAPPFLLVHEESDRTVPVSNSDDLVKALKQANARDVTYRRYSDGSGHGVFTRNIDETGTAMEEFFARTIGRK